MKRSAESGPVFAWFSLIRGFRTFWLNFGCTVPRGDKVRRGGRRPLGMLSDSAKRLLFLLFCHQDVPRANRLPRMSVIVDGAL